MDLTNILIGMIVGAVMTKSFGYLYPTVQEKFNYLNLKSIIAPDKSIKPKSYNDRLDHLEKEVEILKMQKGGYVVMGSNHRLLLSKND